MTQTQSAHHGGLSRRSPPPAPGRFVYTLPPSMPRIDTQENSVLECGGSFLDPFILPH